MKHRGYMALIISIKAVPSSGQFRWTLDKNGQLKVYLKSPAEKGLANKEIIKEFSRVLKIPQQDIEIIAGQQARIKKIKFYCQLDASTLLKKLGLEVNNSLF